MSALCGSWRREISPRRLHASRHLPPLPSAAIAFEKASLHAGRGGVQLIRLAALCAMAWDGRWGRDGVVAVGSQRA